MKKELPSEQTIQRWTREVLQLQDDDDVRVAATSRHVEIHWTQGKRHWQQVHIPCAARDLHWSQVAGALIAAVAKLGPSCAEHRHNT